MSQNTNFEQELQKRKEILDDVLSNRLDDMKEIADLLFQTIKNGNKILTAGNGGSAANAQHITGDIIGRYKLERRGYPALSLTVDPTVVTAISNDYGYENIFERQIDGLGKAGDLLIVLSSSAHSKNLVKAVKKAKEMDIQTVGILGNKGGSIGEHLTKSIHFDFSESDLVEEIAMTMFHIILMEVEQNLVHLDEENGNDN